MKEKKKNKLLSFLLIIILLASISYFIITLVYQKNNIDFIISLISSLLLCLFACLFVITELTNPSKKKVKVYITSIIFILYLSFAILNTLNILPIIKIKKLEDFSNKSLTEVIKWSEENNIKINQIYEYSDLVKEYHIISQNKKNNTFIKDIKELTVVVSEGPSPDKEIIIPNMINWKGQKVLDYIEKNYLNNVSISFKESDKIKNTVIEQNISGTKKRSDNLNIVFSLGNEEEVDDTTTLINLKNKTKLEAEYFLKQHLINYEIEYDFSNSIKRGKVIKTNLNIGTTLKKNDTNKLKLIISKGPKITVPDLTKYSMTKITKWIIDHKLKLEFKDQYDDNIKENKVISANYNKGDIIEEKTLITITLSKGKLIMEGFDSLDEFKNWANKYGINYEEKYIFNSEVNSGEVISYSHKKGDTIKNGDTIIVTISQGKKTVVPNLINKTKEAAIKLLENANLKYNFVYEYSTKTKNTVLGQSLEANKEVAENTTITITLSNGKQQNNYSKNDAPATNNTTTSDNKTVSCDKNIKAKIYIYDELLADSASATCANIKKAYPKFKFSCTYQTGTGMASGLLLNSQEIDSKDFNYCDTITLKIIQN